MADFTPAEKLKIAKIKRIAPTVLEAHLASLGDTLTDDVRTAVREELAKWDSVGGAFTSFTPTESNKGLNLNAKAAKADVRTNIGIYLEMDDSYSDCGFGSVQIGT
jgi:hypothetical protein